ncbi:MAG: DUF5694 domain-containing protein [Chitinophagaceae bacterium]
MKKWIYLLAAISFFNAASAQKVNWKKINSADPDQILLQKGSVPTQVLLLGTFHFAYPNSDSYKTDSSDFVDVLSTVRQREMQELVDVIKRFKPTRVYVESTRQAYHDSLYREYRAGRFTLDRNEIFQIAYRTAGEMNLPGLYAVDASNFLSEQYKNIPALAAAWNTKAMVDSLRDKRWQLAYGRLYKVGDSIQRDFTMLENFLLMAQPKVLLRENGAYLTTGFNTTNNDGPDALATWWYNRNLRIYNNILKTKPVSGDRIIVLFGNGHMSHLNDFFRSSPEFEVIELKKLLKRR